MILRARRRPGGRWVATGVVALVVLSGCGSADTPATATATTQALTDARLESALLTEADLPDGVDAVRVEETDEDPPAPPEPDDTFCGYGHPTEGFVPSADAAVQFASNDPSLESDGPTPWFAELLTALPAGDADAVMANYREALAACPTETSLDSTATGSQTTLPVDAVGDDRLAFTATLADPAGGVTFASDYVVVRNGDLLTTLVTGGMDHDTTRALVDAAQERLEALSP